jgi:hypothetical protein|tara:strand:+ start:120 stop:359 length:240 start_codon:yes stop_codon:yes gene_type:complete
MEITPIKQNKMELTTTTFEQKHDEIFNDLDHYTDLDEKHIDYLSEDEVHDHTLDDTREFFADLGYTYAEITKVQDELWG